VGELAKLNQLEKINPVECDTLSIIAPKMLLTTLYLNVYVLATQNQLFSWW